jgi:hypothetical protein
MINKCRNCRNFTKQRIKLPSGSNYFNYYSCYGETRTIDSTEPRNKNCYVSNEV